MAKVVIHRAVARVTSTEAALRLVTQVMYEVEFGAKIAAAGGPYSVNNLSESIHRTGPVVAGNRVTGRVGSRLKYAASVHSGAKHHIILPVRRRALKFFWRKVGHVVYFDSVSHPGIRHGKHYLTRPLRDAARRHGMRYIPLEVSLDV